MPQSESWSHNVELKARLADLAGANRVAAELGAENAGVLHQIDTYYKSANGRLKLREIVGERAELIAYSRPDQAESKLSQYVIARIDQPLPLHQCLAFAWGVEAVVEKHRQLWLYRNVRIHLDRVELLGDFLEFEAVLDGEAQVDEGQRLLRELSARFEIRDVDLVEGSYRELMLARAAR